MLCNDIPFLGGRAHEGFAKAALKILEETKDVLAEALENYPDFRLFITGHSLGAGVAVYVAMAIRNGEIKDYVPKDVKMLCRAYAPCPLFYSEVLKNLLILLNASQLPFSPTS